MYVCRKFAHCVASYIVLQSLQYNATECNARLDHTLSEKIGLPTKYTNLFSITYHE